MNALKRTVPGALAVAMLLVPAYSLAGAKIEIGDDSSIDLGFRLQTHYIFSDEDSVDAGLVGSGDRNNFDIRRARFRLKGIVNEYASVFFQSEFSESGGPGGNIGFIDAFATIKPFATDWLQIVAGEHMAPTLRQNLTSSGGPLTLDRPGVIYKSLNWTLEGRSQFTRTAFTSPDIETSEVAVRDLGVTLFSSTSFSPFVHGKFYASITDGAEAARTDGDLGDGNADDENRFAFRSQINFGDAEPGYFNLATYLGELSTVGVGISYDIQDGIGTRQDSGADIDYEIFSVDVFAEQPLGVGSITAEAAYIDLSLDNGSGSSFFTGLGDGGERLAAGQTVDQIEGDGFYVQGGYFINNWQPWAEYETWDAPDDLGSYDAFRVGLSYYLAGHNANFKIGFEHFEPDSGFPRAATPTGLDLDDRQTVITAFHVTY